jgi:PhnB protein
MPVTNGDSVALSFTCDSDQEVESLFKALGAGGRPTMPPHDAFWGARFAMLVDQFGMHWMLSHRTNA